MNFNVYFTDGATMELRSIPSLRKLAQMMLDLPYNSHPVKFVSVSTGKAFFFDEKVAQALLQDEITEVEFVERLQCDGLYRNTVAIDLQNGTVIDVDALFMRRGRFFYLVDDDNHCAIAYNDGDFIEI